MSNFEKLKVNKERQDELMNAAKKAAKWHVSFKCKKGIKNMIYAKIFATELKLCCKLIELYQKDYSKLKETVIV